MLSWNSMLLRFSPLHLMVEDSYVFVSLNTRPRCNPRAEFILLSRNIHISFVVSLNPPVIFIGNTRNSVPSRTCMWVPKKLKKLLH